jgi:flagellar assembly factor FliW
VGGSAGPIGAGDIHSSPMALTIESSRFGRVEIAQDSVVDFPDGLIGLGGSRYALISTDPNSPFLWLHSLDDPGLALPVTNPHRFFRDFTVELNDEDAERLHFTDATAADVYVTVTAAPVLENVTANLRAPILIAGGAGHQVINRAPGAELRVQLFPSAGEGPEA